MFYFLWGVIIDEAIVSLICIEKEKIIVLEKFEI